MMARIEIEIPEDAKSIKVDIVCATCGRALEAKVKTFTASVPDLEVEPCLICDE